MTKRYVFPLHEKLRAEGYEFRIHHKLCDAVRERTEREAHGFECKMIMETMCHERYVLIYVAYRPLTVRPTRRERGCFIT
jgi:hypothetical protein